METKEQLNATTICDASVTRNGEVAEKLEAKGRFEVVCIGPDGKEKWREEFDNVVTTVGRNAILDDALAGSGYTVVGPFMGLISSVSYAAGPVAADTMTSHAGWTEAGGANAPTYTAPRKTAAWAAATGASKALSAPLTFAITGAGTVKGTFMVFGTGALSTIDNTAGVLLSAGLFAGGDKPVGAGDTLNCSWSLAI